VITRQERFLEPWFAARTRLPALFAKLRRDDRSRLRTIDSLQRGVRSYESDYAQPLIAAARRGGRAATRVVASGEGKQRVDALRAQFQTLSTAQSRSSISREASAVAAGRAAVRWGIAGLAGSLLLILLFAFYLARAIVLPLRRVASAADRVAGGDLAARLPVRGHDELAMVSASFNTMAEALQQNRDELESQNSELEMQTAELEDHQQRLATSNDELLAQRSELEHTTAQLAEEKERVEEYNAFGDLLASETDVDACARHALATLGDVANAEAAVIYAGGDEGTHPRRLAVRGLAAEGLPTQLAPGDGLAGRALAEARVITASHGTTTLRVPALGESVPARHEVHIPLRYGARVLGVVTLACLTDEQLTPSLLQKLEHLADQAAVALTNAFALAEVRRLERINRVVLDGARDGIMLIDNNGNRVLINAPLERLAQDLTGMSVTEVNAELGPKGIAALMVDPDAYTAALARIDADPDEETFDEFESTATKRSFTRTTTPVSDDRGERIGRITVVREVTAERQAERLKNDLMATVSHELRTPLASVVGFTELLIEREHDAATRADYLRTIHTEAQRLSALISEFLDLQRIEDGKLDLALDPFELDVLLGEQVALYAGQSNDHTLELDLPELSLVGLGARDRIAQVVGNLISNAIKYSPDGGPVKVEGSQRNGTVAVIVTDCGLGVPAEQQPRLFEKFFRVDTHDTRRIGGTGLGLALSREIVELHGGRIGFESVETQGSRFWFEIPAGE
jgi:signal transduction histidine kinase